LTNYNSSLLLNYRISERLADGDRSAPQGDMEMTMLEALKTKTIETTAGLLSAAAGLGVSPLDPSSVAVAVGGLMLQRVRRYVRGAPASAVKRSTQSR
jgi:hypothetical protein